MTIHPSLKISEKDKKQRSVLKRAERIRQMVEKGKWKEGDPVYGLPKVKTIRIKIKKEKVEKAPETAAAAEGAPAPTPETKEAAGAKPAPTKSTEKK